MQTISNLIISLINRSFHFLNNDFWSTTNIVVIAAIGYWEGCNCGYFVHQNK